MNRKGQAAMEFLITYGWAILAAIVAIGVLAYFLSSPGRLTANSCTVAAPFNCNAAAVDAAADIVSLEMRNGGGETFTLTNVTLTSCASGGANDTAGSILADNMLSIVIPCGVTPGTTYRGDITITYRKVGSNLDQVTTGRLIQRL